MREATLELLAARADVWSFIAEPYHLSDWWPGITGIQPDRRGVSPGARWKVLVRKRNILAGPRPAETMLLVGTVEPFERFAFTVLATKLEAEVRLQAAAADRTLVTVATNRGSPGEPLRRLYDLVQTAAAL